MKRRSFLAALGLAPVAAKANPSPAPTSGSIRLSNKEPLSPWNMRNAASSADCEMIRITAGGQEFYVPAWK